MNDMMRVWQLPAFGLSNLVLARRPRPTPARGEVLVRVGAVALNYRDKLVVEGELLPYRPAMPLSAAGRRAKRRYAQVIAEASLYPRPAYRG